jgi:hypothetical protein
VEEPIRRLVPDRPGRSLGQPQGSIDCALNAAGPPGVSLNISRKVIHDPQNLAIASTGKNDSIGTEQFSGNQVFFNLKRPKYATEN